MKLYVAVFDGGVVLVQHGGKLLDSQTLLMAEFSTRFVHDAISILWRIFHVSPKLFAASHANLIILNL